MICLTKPTPISKDPVGVGGEKQHQMTPGRTLFAVTTDVNPEGP